MSQNAVLSIKGLGLSVEILFLQEIPFEDQPIILLGLLGEKLVEAETPPKIKTLRPRISRSELTTQSYEDSSRWVPHFTRNSESMAFDRVTFGNREGSIEKKSKVLRLKKNEKARMSKPKTKMTKRAWRKTGKAVASMVPSAQHLNRLLKSSSARPPYLA